MKTTSIIISLVILLAACTNSPQYTNSDPQQAIKREIDRRARECYHRNAQLIFGGWNRGELDYWCEQTAIAEMRKQGLIR